jgi:hypothetical protein
MAAAARDGRGSPSGSATTTSVDEQMTAWVRTEDAVIGSPSIGGGVKPGSGHALTKARGGSAVTDVVGAGGVVVVPMVVVVVVVVVGGAVVVDVGWAVVGVVGGRGTGGGEP